MAVDHWNGVDVLVNNVAIQFNETPFHEITDEMWDNLMNINVTSYFRFSKHVIRQFLRQKPVCGNIINMSSIHGLSSCRGVGPYAASKGAILSMTRQIGVEYASHNIRVNAICPGILISYCHEVTSVHVSLCVQFSPYESRHTHTDFTPSFF